MVTIVIPHYQTPDLITLCLRSIRKYTPQPYKVIVVDNDSGDESLEYLKSVKWINLVQRKDGEMKTGSWAHGEALDKGLSKTQTEFFLVIHSDVIIKHSAWLNLLLSPFQECPAVACVGTGKLEDVSEVYRIIKKMGDVKGLLGHFSRKIQHHQPLPEYIRTTCAMYRTEILKKENLSFLPIGEKEMTSGQALYYELVQKGYQTRFLPSDTLKKVIAHLNHGTMVLNPALGARKRTIFQGEKRIKKKLKEGWITSILEDPSLDR